MTKHNPVLIEQYYNIWSKSYQFACQGPTGWKDPLRLMCSLLQPPESIATIVWEKNKIISYYNYLLTGSSGFLIIWSTWLHLNCSKTSLVRVSAYFASHVWEFLGINCFENQITGSNKLPKSVSRTSVHSVSCTSPYRPRWVEAAAANGFCAFSHSGCRRRHRTAPSSPRISFLWYLKGNDESRLMCEEII